MGLVTKVMMDSTATPVVERKIQHHRLRHRQLQATPIMVVATLQEQLMEDLLIALRIHIFARAITATEMETQDLVIKEITDQTEMLADQK